MNEIKAGLYAILNDPKVDDYNELGIPELFNALYMDELNSHDIDAFIEETKEEHGREDFHVRRMTEDELNYYIELLNELINE